MHNIEKWSELKISSLKLTTKQKNILYNIYAFVQNVVKEQEKLPERIKIDLPVDHFKYRSGKSEYIKRVIGLQSKNITYNYKVEKQSFTASTSLLGNVLYKKGSKSIQVELLRQSIILLTHIFPESETSLNIAASFNHVHTKGLYELICNEKNNVVVSIAIKELRTLLGVRKKYEKYSSFKRYVLEPAKKEMQAKADLYFEYIEIREGHRYTKIDFTIIWKNKHGHDQS